MVAKKVLSVTKGYEGFDRCTRQRTVALDKGSGLVRLANRICVRDEYGRCTGRDIEVVTNTIWAKKEFLIDDIRLSGATLALRVDCEVARGASAEQDARVDVDPRSATLCIEVNGNSLELEWPKRREYWKTRCIPVPVPVQYLREGVNEFVFHSSDATEWYLLIEDSLWPNRSAKSVDAGLSWDYEHLGLTGGHDGEYLMRLELEGYPSQGELTSPTIDLARLASGGRIGVPVVLGEIAVHCEAVVPPGASLEFQVRGGLTPSYDPSNWTPWRSLDDTHALAARAPRFVQWRALLGTTDPRVTPMVREVTLLANVELTVEDGVERFEVLGDNAPTIARSSYHFAYQSSGEERLRIARERWELDKVVQGAKTELEELVRLCDWTRQQWENGWNSGGELKYCPPWDGLVVRELASRGLSLGMCTHYATVFVQACTALGFVARHNVIRAHCVAEVWSNEYQKWVMFDPGCDMDDQVKGTYHLEQEGVPLSALEAHEAWLSREFDRTKMVPELYKPRFALDTWLEAFERFSITLREDDLTSLSAGEPEHGWSPYHFDRYLWWEDEKTPKLEWFTLSTDRIADMYWGLNQVEVHLMWAGEDGRLWVTLDSVTPNFDRYESRIDAGVWEEVSSDFSWKLHPGENRLDLRSLNRLGRPGPTSSLQIVLAD
jgi:hypothetical protein